MESTGVLVWQASMIALGRLSRLRSQNIMRCSGCGAENASDRLFCAECGGPLAVVCPACGFDNQPSAKFCGGCAARLNASP